MNVKQVNAVNNIFVALRNHWCVYTIVALYFLSATPDYGMSAEPLFIWFLLGLLPVLLYFIRKHLKNHFLIYGIYLLVIIGIMMIPVPQDFHRIIYLLGGVYYCVFSRYAQRKDGEGDKPIPIWVTFIITFVVLILLQYMQFYDYQRFFLYLIIINIALYCMGSYVSRYDKYLMMNRHSIGYIPVKDILKAGMIIMLFFSLIVSFFSWIIANIGHMGDVLYRFMEMMASLDKKVHEVIRRNNVDQELLYEPILNEDGTINYVPTEEVQSSVFWEILLYIIFAAIGIFIVYKIIRFLWNWLRNFSLGRGREKTEKKIEDIRESCDTIEKLDKKRHESILSMLSPRQRIRRRYKRKINTSQQIIVSKLKRSEMEFYTARECSNILENSQIGDIYEKARYSQYECTAEDVKMMKDACK